MDKLSDWLSFASKVFRQLKWRLTLTYTLVALTAVIIMGWWVFIAATFYLYRIQTELNLLEVMQEFVLPSLGLILPGVFILLLPAILLSSYFGFLSARWLDKRLSGLRLATQSWRRGDFSVSIKDDSNDEVGAFGQELNRMAEELEQLMTTRQTLATVEERYRLARDLHDSVKQTLTAAGFQLSAARELTGEKEEAAKECLARAEDLIYEAQQELSAVIAELRPPGLRDHEFSGALREFIDKWSEREHAQASFTVKDERKIGSQVEECLFRLLQEALSNIARHSNASHAAIILEYLPEEVVLTVIDNGRGFDPKTVKDKGHGLRNMHERITSLNGNLVLSSNPGKGSSVKANIPA
jgi:two-component system, NarL family, sensor histidine kinase LiaS